MGRPKVPPEQREVTKRERTFLRALVKGATLTDAAKTAGYAEASAGQEGYRVLNRLKLKMPDLMDRLEVSDSFLVEKCLKPALNAQETKFFQKDGIVTDERNVIAWGPRIQALDLAFKLRGSYSADKIPAAVITIPVQFVVNAALPDA